MKVGYIRVSTDTQHKYLQEDALRNAGCERFYEDVGTGAKYNRPGLQQTLDYLRAGDTLVVWKLDRLGRTTKELLGFVEQLKAEGIGFESLQEKIDTSTPMGECFLTIIAAFAQLERAILRERTQAGLAAARARGHIGGRKRKMTRELLHDAMVLMARPGRNASAVARRVGVSRGVLYRYVEADGQPTALGQYLLGGTGSVLEALDAAD